MATVQIRENFCEASDRALADAYATLGNAYGMLGNETATLECRRKAVACLEAEAAEAVEHGKPEASIEGLRSLVAEMQQEVRELAAGVIARTQSNKRPADAEATNTSSNKAAKR